MAQTTLSTLQDQTEYTGEGRYVRKFTIALADFVAAGANTGGDILLVNLPPKTLVRWGFIKHSQAAAGAGPLSAATILVKTSITTSGLCGAAFDVFQAVSATALQSFLPVAGQGATGGVQNYGAVTPVLATYALTGGNANAITAGSVDVILKYDVLP